MGKVYTQVTMEERCEIARLRALGSRFRGNDGGGVRE